MLSVGDTGRVAEWSKAQAKFYRHGEVWSSILSAAIIILKI